MTLAVGTQTIKSERLILRRLRLSDLDEFAEFHADVDVARYIGTGQPRSKAETEVWLHSILETYEVSQLGQLVVTRKSDGMIVGRCGLSDAAIERTSTEGQLKRGWFFSSQAPSGVDIENVPELGYTFAKQYWGQGYASEAARCVYDYVREARHFPKIMSVIHSENRASYGVVQKFGVTYVDCVEFGGRPFDRYHWPVSDE
jgi:[ribosomal protein S5]-alanine N-acetyltransferase